MSRRLIVKGVATIIGVSIAIGTSMHDKVTLAKETKQEMLTICGVNNDCIKAVNDSFDRCFKTSMEVDTLDIGKLADCVNIYAGKPYFAYEY